MDGKKVRFAIGSSTSSKNLTSTSGQRAKGNDNTQRKKLLSSAGQAAGASSDAHRKEPSVSSVQATGPSSDACRKEPSASSVRATGPNSDARRKEPSASSVRVTGPSSDTRRKKPSASSMQPAQPSSNPMDLQVMEEYAEFEQKVKKTVYLDNLSHKVDKNVVRSALEQFGSVVKIDFMENYTIPFDIPQSALVEMETDKQAESVVTLMNEYPFMMAGMPRPVRARLAEARMFQDRPRRPGMNFDVRWTNCSDTDFRRIRDTIKVQEKERLALIKHQLEQEEELAKKQHETLDDYMKKHELVEGQSKKVRQLLRAYGINPDNV